MKKILWLVFTTLLVALISCEKNETIDPFSSEGSNDGKIIDNNLISLNERIEFTKSPLLYTFYDPDPDLKGSLASSIDIQVIADLESPRYKKETLQASHIRITDGFAYIGYNTQGERYLGGIDIVDINPATDPKLISNVIFINPETNFGKDVSSIDIEPKVPGFNNFLWFAGAEEGNPLLTSPAIAERMTLNADNQFEQNNNPRQVFDLKGYVGTDVRFFKDKIYITSGTGGGLTVLNKELSELNFYSIENARSVDVNKNYTVALGGNPGHLYGPGVWDSEIGGATDPEAKSIVRLCYETGGTIVTKGTKCTGNFALVALGEDGLKCFNLNISSSVPVSALPRPVIQDEAKEWDYVTNGVSIANGGWVYIANGAAGLDIAKMDLKGNLTLLGNIDLGASVNFVEASDNYVFVATGLGGLKILKVTENI
ncbi:MAG TPA: hypothetical protein PK719_03135 [Bacteroidales bacterium]|jgi:hypothetical protein|nr:hypothetical protein [Bacteroidales bacterium]OQB64452.1 MAG: hypothetical protein BWX96_00590 [Bacteroidetes bacterium ADurb.Bin145]NMD03241.1 hypothetical protein [Bacteroidales bacterium]HOU02577.1 hypothetical protein [Bacteroidales bacterium]HQG62629.1 hypothetical protein [Bacteroidales bacterium]